MSGTQSNRASTITTKTVTTGRTARPKSGLVPTNTIVTKEGQQIRAKIDHTLSVNHVIRTLCANLNMPDAYSQYALRDENDVLAAEIYEKMRDEKTQRLALFSLAKFMRDDEFINHFIAIGGLRDLIYIIEHSAGNILAYSLTAMQNLMDKDYGWEDLGSTFIFRVVTILATPSSLINVCRPASAILRRLVEADPRSAPGPATGSSKSRPTNQRTVFRYGFDRVYSEMQKAPSMLEVVVSRLGSGDNLMKLNSMMLVNSLLSHVTEARWEQLTGALERLNIRKTVLSLMPSSLEDHLTSSILDFQGNLIRVAYRRKTTPVDPLGNPGHTAALTFIWEVSRLQEEVAVVHTPNGAGRGTRHVFKWRRIGFQTEDLRAEFDRVGVLGLDSLKHFVDDDPDYFANVVLEQVNRPPERRCPVARASNEVVEVLCDHWSIFGLSYSTSTQFQPFFLNFAKVHIMALRFFLRMWSESQSTVNDFQRVVMLLRSQVKLALRTEADRPWHEVERDFHESNYRAVRDRQMKELEKDDEVVAKPPVRNLREKLYKESYQFVKQQRIQCLVQGAWFINGIPVNTSVPREALKRPARPWRFMRLDNSQKYLHYIDSAVKFSVKNGLEDLPDRIEIAQIGEVQVGTCFAPPTLTRDSVDLPPAVIPRAAETSFSIISTREEPIADQIALDHSTWADWTDGLNMLRGGGGHLATQETAAFVNALTEIGLKVKLLSLSGEKVDIPSALDPGFPPPTCDFFFADAPPG
ncbi:ELMO/CED-12 family-domain-containing protein [Auriculariales sp. MPI-PUGE-AT-0066]|nr:ELMO/CED-12 family-domain-containing protein [Auriculariales sp. MPI-PUGE-AT-0066]